MKTKQIKGAVDIVLVTDLYKGAFEGYCNEMYSNGWKFHCRLSKMIEEQATPLIKTGVIPFEYWDYVKNYWGDEPYCASDAFQSLLQSNGVLPKNPYGDYDHALKYFTVKEWQEAEANVFPPETTLVFIKQ